MKKLIRSTALLAILFALVSSSVQASGPAKLPFVVSAAKAIDQIKDLEKVSGKKLAIHPEEAKLLDEASKGKLEAISFADAALIASGAADRDARTKYMEQLHQIEADARKALAGAGSSAEKGDKLLKFLHA